LTVSYLRSAFTARQIAFSRGLAAKDRQNLEVLVRKRIALLGATVGAVAAMGLALAAPANADSQVVIYTNGTAAGVGQFASYGEHFYACDVKTDGYGVQVDWYVVANPSNSGSVRDGNGNNGDCATQNASISEGRAVNYRVCLTNNGSEIACTAYVRDYA
jgi:hypothetical protein